MKILKNMSQGMEWVIVFCHLHEVALQFHVTFEVNGGFLFCS